MKPFKEGHLAPEAGRALLEGALGASDLRKAAEHLAACPVCAAKLADAAENSGSLGNAARGFAGAVAERLEREKNAKKRGLYLYAAEVAACAAIVVGISAGMIMSSPRPEAAAAHFAPIEVPSPGRIEVPEPGSEKGIVERVGEFFCGLADSILTLEDSNDDKTEK
jgi:hypothetical protein